MRKNTNTIQTHNKTSMSDQVCYDCGSLLEVNDKGELECPKCGIFTGY